MKMKIKSLCIALLMMLCVIPMTACGSEEKVVESTVDAATVASLEEQEVLYLQAFAQLTDEQIESLITSEDAFTVSAMTAWTDNKEEIGEFVEVVSSEVEENEDGLYVIKTDAKFENKDVTVTMNFDMTTGYPTYMTMEVQYTLGELLTQAGMNTVMGVGIVFSVLLFLTLLIGCFKYIGKAVEGSNKKTAAKSATVPAPVVTAPVVEENLVDDGELVAVIAAAIAASENTSTDSFVVRSIRRKNSNKWSRA